MAGFEITLNGTTVSSSAVQSPGVSTAVPLPWIVQQIGTARTILTPGSSNNVAAATNYSGVMSCPTSTRC
jgi:hypothetical protein